MILQVVQTPVEILLVVIPVLLVVPVPLVPVLPVQIPRKKKDSLHP